MSAVLSIFKSIAEKFSGYVNWLVALIASQREVRIVMLGLDSAGKTTLLYRLKLGESVNTIPTIGFNVENVAFKNMSINVWDIGGQYKIRQLWKHYFQNCDAVIFVVDSCDRDRFNEAKQELDILFEEPELKRAAFLILSNKQDLPGAVKPEELAVALGLNERDQRLCNWQIQNLVATSGDGLQEALQWLYTVLISHKKSEDSRTIG